jgi:aquaporin Z
MFVGGWALAQLWLFWVAPIVGALAAGFSYAWIAYDIGEPIVGDPEPAEIT